MDGDTLPKHIGSLMTPSWDRFKLLTVAGKAIKTPKRDERKAMRRRQKVQILPTQYQTR